MVALSAAIGGTLAMAEVVETVEDSPPAAFHSMRHACIGRDAHAQALGSPSC